MIGPTGAVQVRVATKRSRIFGTSTRTPAPRAFELVQLTDPEIARDISRQNNHGAGAQFRWTADSAEAAYRAKCARITRPTAMIKSSLPFRRWSSASASGRSIASGFQARTAPV